MYKLQAVDIEALKAISARPTHWSRVAVALEKTLGIRREYGARGRDKILEKLGLIKVIGHKVPPGGACEVPYFRITEAGKAALSAPDRPVGDMRISPSEKAFLVAILVEKKGVGVIQRGIPKMGYTRAKIIGKRLQDLGLVTAFRTASGHLGYAITEEGKRASEVAEVVDNPRPKKTFAGKMARRGQAQETILSRLRAGRPMTVAQLHDPGVRRNTTHLCLHRLVASGVIRVLEKPVTNKSDRLVSKLYVLVEQESANAAE